jgi:hypothetical protein
MAAKKKSAGSSEPKTKKPAAKTAKKKAAAKKSAAKSKPAAKSGSKKEADAPAVAATTPDPGSKAAPSSGGKATISSSDVNMGHVFALRPRPNTSFRQHDFLRAKRALEEEPYSDLAEAARAVAEEALALTRGTSDRVDTPVRR